MKATPPRMLMVLALACGLFAPSMSDASARTESRAAPQRIDLELQSADIHQVLRMFAEIGNVNIVAQAGVQGKVTARFMGTPWNEALGQVLTALNLEATREGNVIYVCVRS